MQNLIEPNIHPILVHFAYALPITAAVIYVASSFSQAKRWQASLRPAADWMLALGAIAIVATIAAGFQAYYTVDHDTPSHAVMTTHRNWAVPSGLAILALAAWRWKARSNPASGLFTGLTVITALALTVTAWWGGKAVYGYGLGVASLPTVTGDGHDHDHGDPSANTQSVAPHDEAGATSHEHDTTAGDGTTPSAAHDDAGSAPHDHPDTPAASVVPAGHDNSDGHHDTETSPPTASVAPAEQGSPAEIAEAFQSALRAEDKTKLEALFLPDVVLAEGGGAERSFEEYAGHHMTSDMAYTAAIDTTVISRDVIENGDLATVITEAQMHGEYKGKTIHNRMMETMVLRRSDEGWRIAHIHWSSAPITEEDEH